MKLEGNKEDNVNDDSLKSIENDLLYDGIESKKEDKENIQNKSKDSEIVQNIKNNRLKESNIIYTSIIPNLLCKEVVKAIDDSKAEVMYICNIMTQPGETDGFTASQHVKALNEYLGDKKVSMIIANKGNISEEYLTRYLVAEQKDPVIIDDEELEKMNVKVITEDLISTEDGTLKHDSFKLGIVICSQLTL